MNYENSLDHDSTEQELQELEQGILHQRDQILLEMWAPGGNPIIPLKLDAVEPICLVKNDNLPHGRSSLELLPSGEWGVQSDTLNSSVKKVDNLLLEKYALNTDPKFQAIDSQMWLELEKSTTYEEDRVVEDKYDKIVEEYIGNNRLSLMSGLNGLLQDTLTRLKTLSEQDDSPI